MKDLYTFDKTVEKAQETYDSICQAYHNVFQRLGVPFVKGSKITFTLFSFSHRENSSDRAHTITFSDGYHCSCRSNRKHWRPSFP